MKLMRRRTLLRWLAAFAPLRTWAQTTGFPDDQGAKLRLLARTVLPSELGPDAPAAIAARFELWVRNYRPGAEMDHGYGFTRLRTKPPSPAATYVRQLRDLALVDDLEQNRHLVEAALEVSKINSLPQTPDGHHIAADLMAFYFRSSEANDLCYRAHIGRDECRGLAGSNKEPR